MRSLSELQRPAGRGADAPARREVAHALLGVPADEALAALPQLRRRLMATGAPFSAAFWEAATTILRAIGEGSASIGDVLGWLEANGEPTSLLLDMGVTWSAPPERGPVEAELHDLLAAHIDEAVAAGRIDLDRLLAGDRRALDDYEALQRRWLETPLPDGRVPLHALWDEEGDEVEAAWSQASAAAGAELRETLHGVGPRPCPTDELATACAVLREELGGDRRPFPLLRAAGGVDVAALPEDDERLWLQLACGVVECQDEPPAGWGETHAAWLALDHFDWLALVEQVALAGPGAFLDAEELAATALADEDVDDDDVDVVGYGYEIALSLWQAIGALDDEGRLTELGWWGIPAALLELWPPADPNPL